MSKMKKILFFLVLILFVYLSASYAGEADVIQVDTKQFNDNTYHFNVTISHKDTGWKHYVNKWDIIGKDGIVFGARTLHHPHVNEQPFTRSLSGVVIPVHIKSVTIRAHDSMHQYGGKVITVEIP